MMPETLAMPPVRMPEMEPFSTRTICEGSITPVSRPMTSPATVAIVTAWSASRILIAM